MAGVIGGAMCVVGLVLIIIGTAISVADWNKIHKAPVARDGEFTTEAAGAADILVGLEKLFTAIGGFPTGRFLMALGFAILLFGAIVSTVGALTA